MNRSDESLYLLTFFIPLLMGVLSIVLSHRLKSIEFKHLSEFWASWAVMEVVNYIFHSDNEFIAGFALFGWIWPIKTNIQVIKEISGIDFYLRDKAIILACGGLLTLILASFKFPFAIYTAPFCLSVGVVGAMLIGKVYTRIDSRKISILGHSSFLFLGLFYIVRFLYPLGGMTEFGRMADIFVLIGLAASLVSFHMEVLKEAHDKKCQQALNERSAQFLGQSKYSELGMMSAGIAHEINNPLAIIQAKTTQLLRILHNPNSYKEVSEGLEQILNSSERISRTVQGVRNFVHQDQRMPSEKFSVKNLVDDVLAFCGQRMKNHGVNLRFYGFQDYQLQGYKIQLEQVLLSLLNNSFDAIEFLPDKWIELNVHETESTIQIYVKDSGNGIPPETASRMMEAFFTTKKVGKGTGLGLALARGIVEKHGGSLIYLANTLHTTFLLELPKPSQLRSEVMQRDHDLRQPLANH